MRGSIAEESSRVGSVGARAVVVVLRDRLPLGLGCAARNAGLPIASKRMPLRSSLSVVLRRISLLLNHGFL
jgi:hypothetical protein